MSLTEFLDRLNRGLSLLEVAEDQMVEAVSELQMCELYPEANEVRVLRKSLNRTLTDLFNRQQAEWQAAFDRRQDQMEAERRYEEIQDQINSNRRNRFDCDFDFE